MVEDLVREYTADGAAVVAPQPGKQPDEAAGDDDSDCSAR
jgi:hypothetical protein